MPRVLVATSNPGKLRDFAAIAAPHGVEAASLPGIDRLPAVVEDGATFEANARKKAEFYSRHAPGEMVIADDSGLEVDALGGAPGVRSARYAAGAHGNASDQANNHRLLRELTHTPEEKRGARFVCMLAAARDGHTLGIFKGEAKGSILRQARGSGGFGYDPLFYFPDLKKTFAELTPAKKAQVSHRGQAFRQFLEWFLRDTNAAANHRLGAEG